jgi:hypothetical protein
VGIVPSLSHEALVELFRDWPKLAAELLRAAGYDLPNDYEVRTDSADFTQLVPTQFVADLLTLLVKGKPVLALILEVQLDVDREKGFSSRRVCGADGMSRRRHGEGLAIH